MKRELLKMALRKMKNDRTTMFDHLKSLDPESLTIPESDDRWSVNQVLGHLLISENGMEQYIRKKMQSDHLGGSAVAAKLRSLLVIVLMRSPIKVKAPPGVGNPSSDLSFSDLLIEFEESMVRWSELLEEFPDKHLEKPIFKHPLVGRLTMKGTLSFIESHHLLHYRQIDRILTKLEIK